MLLFLLGGGTLDAVRFGKIFVLLLCRIRDRISDKFVFWDEIADDVSGEGDSGVFDDDLDFVVGDTTGEIILSYLIVPASWVGVVPVEGLLLDSNAVETDNPIDLACVATRLTKDLLLSGG